MEYTGFKSQALDFNIYSDGVSVNSVIKEFALAPEDPETSGPFYEIKEGEGENAVKIWEISWSDSPPAYTDYPTRIGSSTEITNNGKNVYWERQITTYSDGEVKASAASKSTMLDVDFINSIGITAKKITVVDDKKNLVFEADSFDPEGLVKIGGFEVDATSLSTGKDTNKVVIKSNVTLEDIPASAGGGVGVYRWNNKTYVLLNYIESTGKEYIDLGIYAKDIASATLDFTYTDVVSSGAALEAVYGTNNGLQIARNKTGAFTDGTNVSSAILDPNKRYICKATYNYSASSQEDVVGTGTLELREHGQTEVKDTLTCDLYQVTTESAVPNVYLFGAFVNDNGGGATYFSKAKIYSCQITGSSGKPSYNFIPVLQVDTNTPGLYETNTNTFYTNNSKQGGLVAGPIADVVPVEIISIALGAEEPSQAPFRVTNKGEVTASAGTIGGFNIGTNTIASGNKTEGVGIQLTSGQTGTGKVIQAGTKFNVDANGNIEAEGGTIGGWTIDGTNKTLTAGVDANTVGLSAEDNLNSPAIWAGANLENATAAPFQVYPTGRLVATSGEIGGFTIDTTYIASGDDDTGIKLTSGANGTQNVIQAGKNFSVDASGSITADAGTIGGWTISDGVLVNTNTTETKTIRLDPSLGITAYDATRLWFLTFPAQVNLSPTLDSVLDITDYEHKNNNIKITSRSQFCGAQVYSIQAGVPQWVQTGYTFTDPEDESGANVTGMWFGCMGSVKQDDGTYKPMPFYGLGNVNGGGGLYLDTVNRVVCLDAYKATDSSNNIGSKNPAPSGIGKIRGSWTGSACLASNSDANLKHEIESLPNDYTSLFDNLKPIRFKYNDGTSNRYHVGFIAQDVEQAILDSGLTTNDVAGYIKEADTVDDSGAVVKEGTRSIRYGEFVALNTDQIQKLKSRVAELETTVAELTKLINEKLN